MNKDKISILDIKTPEQMFHYLNNLPFYYDISKEELEKVDKNILFSFLVWNKHHYFLIKKFKEDVIKYIPKEWWIKEFYIDDILTIKPELFVEFYDDIVNNEKVWKYLFEKDFINEKEKLQYIKYIKDKDFYKLKNIFYKQIETIDKLEKAIENLYEIKEPKITYLDD